MKLFRKTNNEKIQITSNINWSITTNPQYNRKVTIIEIPNSQYQFVYAMNIFHLDNPGFYDYLYMYVEA